MDDSQLIQAQMDYQEELSQHQMVWKNTERSFEDTAQQWQDQSAKNFMIAYIDQMQAVAEQLEYSFNEHEKTLAAMRAYFDAVGVESKDLQHLFEVFLNLVNEQRCLMKKGSNKLVNARCDAELALEKAKDSQDVMSNIK